MHSNGDIADAGLFALNWTLRVSTENNLKALNLCFSNPDVEPIHDDLRVDGFPLRCLVR